MSLVYLIPVKWVCETDGCAGEASATAEAVRDGRKDRLRVPVEPTIPMGWTWDCGPRCPKCAAVIAERPRPYRFATLLEQVTPPAPDPSVVATVAQAGDAVCRTRASCRQYPDRVCPGCAPGDCEHA